VHLGCNVENVAYPEGTCAEAGAIAAMIAAGDTAIAEVAVIADGSDPVPPCGGCRQKLAEFAAPEVVVTMATVDGKTLRMTVGDLLPGRFVADHMDRASAGDLMTTARGILAKLRDGDRVTEAELFWFAEGLASGEVTDSQAGAFAMAVCTRGLGPEGRVQLTNAMRTSGDTLKWDLDGPVLDKHSTGGVGDCVSLLLAPALAACGAYVPMISGRGLGHTGGTLDKLEAIPGYRTNVTIEDLQEIVADIGCAIVGATADIAPADRRLYGVRDVTGTVESIDLITASILSKKLAAGLEALVLDVKVGSGAFMAAPADAHALAEALVKTAQGAGCMTTALVHRHEPAAGALGGQRAGGDRGDGGADRRRHGPRT
jgi:homotetrameric cytidine deaminase